MLHCSNCYDRDRINAVYLIWSKHMEKMLEIFNVSLYAVLARSRIVLQTFIFQQK